MLAKTASSPRYVDGGLGSGVWDAFFKEAMTIPSIKSFKTMMSSGLNSVKSRLSGKPVSEASTSGKGFTGVLGTSGISAHPTPPPPRVL